MALRPHRAERTDLLADGLVQLLAVAWYAGRPILATANDYGLGLYNGNTGVTVVDHDVLRAVIAGVEEPLEFATSRLSEVETMHAMTIHKSQGSQVDEVTVLRGPESRLLSRELFYTAVTRAKERVWIVGPESSLRSAIERRAVRASGLAARLGLGASGAPWIIATKC